MQRREGKGAQGWGESVFGRVAYDTGTVFVICQKGKAAWGGGRAVKTRLPTYGVHRGTRVTTFTAAIKRLTIGYKIIGCNIFCCSLYGLLKTKVCSWDQVWARARALNGYIDSILTDLLNYS